jgi:DnaJ-class molecular chaperone
MKRQVTCDKCNGSGKFDGKTCPKCGGVGKIVERVSESGAVRQTKILNEA